MEMRPLPIAPGARLRLLDEGEAGALTEVIDANREHLGRWLPWAETHGFEDSVEYLRRKQLQWEMNDGFEGAIELDGRIVGGAGFHRVDWVNRCTSIGYWLAADAQGRGLMTATVRALLDHAFGVWGLHRVFIEVVVGNERSKAIPERLGFRQEAVLREAKLIAGRYEDTLLYAMLAPDWESSPAREATGSA
jgi:ribosomal-protein-serine acetyltransferase